MKFLNVLRSILFGLPKIEEKVETAVESIVEIPDVVAEAIAQEAVAPKKKKYIKKK
jgi:hypothetical protein